MGKGHAAAPIEIGGALTRLSLANTDVFGNDRTQQILGQE
jgi:hypothetical protein